MLFGTAMAVRLFLETNREIAFMIGALLVVEAIDRVFAAAHDARGLWP